MNLIDELMQKIMPEKLHKQWIADIEAVPYRVRDPANHNRFVTVHIKVID